MTPFIIRLIGALAGSYLIGRGEADLKILFDNQQELKEKNIKFSDNYYHRKASCEASKLGIADALATLGWGLAKETAEFPYKWHKDGLDSASYDYVKDMNNNIEGIIYGLTNPEKDCNIWLKDLDMERNKWKSK